MPSMYLHISVCLDNAAFDDAAMSESARILRALATRLERESISDHSPTLLHDANGNACGAAILTPQPAHAFFHR